MYHWLPEIIDAGACVVTANQRLARTLSEHYSALQLASGKDVWPTPNIRSLDSWLQELLREVPKQESLPHYLFGQASAIVWERCLREQSLDQLLSVGTLLRQSRQAWRRVCDWQVPTAELAAAARNSDEQLFSTSVARYQSELKKRNWIDDAGLTSLISQLISAGRLRLPPHIVLAGFERTIPVHATLWESLVAAGVKLEEAPRTAHMGSVEIVSADNVVAEMRAAGRWARAELTAQPTSRLAIVVPGLEQNATCFARYIREGLVPGWQADATGLGHLLNVSYGQKLSEYPATYSALLLLRWLNAGLVFRDISLLLRLPFIAQIDDGTRSRIELKLRQFPDRQWSRASIYRITAKWFDGAVNDWRERIASMDRFAIPEAERRSPGDWAKLFADCLESVGWPGGYPLSSPEFQLINRWRELLNEFARLESVIALMPFSKALELLTVLATDTVYQPKTQGAVVQLLGNLESAGMEFDAVWVAGMEASRWPSAANPSNLIPRSVQLKYGMPDATPNDSLDYGRTIFSRLRGCADRVVFSTPRCEDETELLPSPFLQELTGQGQLEANDPGWYAATFTSGHALLVVADDPVPPVYKGEKIGGGAYTIQRQRTEPFSAFAQGRLLAGEIEEVKPGISASLRGNLVHRALQHLYRDLPSLAILDAWADDDLADRIQRATSASIAVQVEEADPVYRRLLYIEKDRLQEVLNGFVTEERRRPEFQVAGVEVEYKFNLGGIDLKLRADRIDQLPDQSIVIIDYKTGAPKVLLDKDRNLKDVQLAVYAFAVPGEISGLVLANVDVRKVEYKGAGGDKDWSVIASEGWPELLNNWKLEVGRLVDQIVAGDVRVNLSLAADKSRPLALLSRVAELKRVD